MKEEEGEENSTTLKDVTIDMATAITGEKGYSAEVSFFEQAKKILLQQQSLHGISTTTTTKDDKKMQDEEKKGEMKLMSHSPPHFYNTLQEELKVYTVPLRIHIANGPHLGCTLTER